MCDFSDWSGKEIITRYTTNMRTRNVFYTDSNGRETLERVRDHRPTWNVSLSEDISGNYYPVTSKISMKDKTKNMELAILTDRAQGGTSLVNGQLELMVSTTEIIFLTTKLNRLFDYYFI